MAYSSVAVTPGVGAGIAFDVAGGLDFQVIKIDVGATGAQAGPVSAVLPLPVQHQLNATDLTEVAINVAGNGDNQLVAASAANKCRVWMWWLKINGAGSGVSLKFKDGAGTDFHPALPFNDKDGWVMGFNTRPWFTSAAVNTALILNLSAAIQVSGRIYYTLTP